MIDVTAAALSAQGAQRIGMLASPATRLAHVFEAPFAAHGLTPVFLPDDSGLLAIIRAIKAGERGTALGPRLRTEAEALRALGADHLLVACTELSLMTDDLPHATPVTDSLDCLTRAIAAFAQG